MSNEANQIPVVDSSCIGCRICASVAPKTFAMKDIPEQGTEISVVIDPHGDEEQVIQEAINICPVTAIHWTQIAEQVKKDLRN